MREHIGQESDPFVAVVGFRDAVPERVLALASRLRWLAGAEVESRHKPKLFGRISSGGLRVSHVKGWGPKSSVCPSKPRKPNF